MREMSSLQALSGPMGVGEKEISGAFLLEALKSQALKTQRRKEEAPGADWAA